MSTPLPAAVEAVHPLSPTQRGLLFHSLYAPQAGVYAVQLEFTLHGALDTAAFEAAWQALVQQHAVLRTAFAWEKLDAPLQVVGRRARLPVQWLDAVDAQQQPAEPCAARWQAVLDDDRQRGFDLRRAPLARVVVLRIDQAEHRVHHRAHHRVLFSHHHLLLDGWSLPLLLRDWQLAYAAACAGQAPQLPAAAPFHEHLAWLAAQDAEAARAWWRQALAGFDQPSTPDFVRPAALAAGPTAMPSAESADTARPTITPPHRALHTLDAGLSEALQALARRTRVTPGTVLQAAWALLLARHTGQAEVVYGLTRAGRPAARPQAAGSVGPFLSTLPLRCALPDALPLGRWLRALQAAVQAQAPHEHLAPAEVQRCASALAPGQALFDSVVVIENYPRAPAPPAGASAPALRLADVQVHEATHYALSLYAVLGTDRDGPGGIELRLLADPARVSAADARRCATQLRQLLQAFVAPGAESRALGGFGLPVDAEAVQNGPNSHPQADAFAPQAIAALARQAPQALAVVDAQGGCSRAALQTRAAQIAQRLQAQGVGPGQLVGVCLARGRDMLAALLAVWRLGAAYVPMDATYPAARLAHMARDAGLATLLLHGATRPALAWYEGMRCDLDETAAETSGHRATATDTEALPHAPLHAHSPAYLIYTSGSTGTPKGVPIGHASLARLLHGFVTRLALRPADRWLAVTTLSFDIAALELFGPLLAGAAVVIADEAEARDPERLARRLNGGAPDEAVTVMQATPSTWRLLVASGWRGRAGQRLLCGGEALDLPLARALLQGPEGKGEGPALWNVYGPTETTVWSTALRLDAALLAEPCGPAAPIGGPLDDTSLCVLDEAGRLLPPGVPGELCIAGVGLSPGYHRRAALSAQRFVPAPGRPHCGPAPGAAGLTMHGHTLYRTGDRVRLREDGLFDILGRLDHQTKLRGHRLELGEVEAALAALPGVAQAVALVRPGPGGPADARLEAYITARAGQPPTADLSTPALRRQLAQRLPAWMLPANIHRLPALPLTPNGKIDRQALPAAAARLAPGAAPEPSSGATPPTDAATQALQQQLLALWRELLQRPQLGLHEHFFEAGGHSLLLLSLQNRLRQQLGRELPLVTLFNHPSVASLAAHLRTLDTEAQAPGPSAATPAPASTEATARAAGRERLLQQRRQRQASAALAEPAEPETP